MKKRVYSKHQIHRFIVTTMPYHVYRDSSGIGHFSTFTCTLFITLRDTDTTSEILNFPGNN